MADFVGDFVGIEVDFEHIVVDSDLHLKLELDFGKLMDFWVFFEEVAFYLNLISMHFHTCQHKII